MSALTKFTLGAAAIFALAMAAAPAARALPTGVQALHLSHGVILARRECIAWRRRPDGTSVCVRWAECGKYVC
jgi:hypothetical protein